MIDGAADGGADPRQAQGQREDRPEEVRTHQVRIAAVTRRGLALALAFAILTLILPPEEGGRPAASQPGKLLVVVNDPDGRDPAHGAGSPSPDRTRRRARRPCRWPSRRPMASRRSTPWSPGRYTIQAEFPGFETVRSATIRVRAGENRRAIILPIKKVAEDVTVGRDKQSASLDPRGNAFSTVLTREQIEALPDDPDEMEAVLKAMSPPGATLRVDGFTGGRLPPKSQIRSIRLPRMDQFAAQNHGGINGLMFIDIMTQPGNGPLRGAADFTFRDEALNARNPFTPVKGDRGTQAGRRVSCPARSCRTSRRSRSRRSTRGSTTRAPLSPRCRAARRSAPSSSRPSAATINGAVRPGDRPGTGCCGSRSRATSSSVATSASAPTICRSARTPRRRPTTCFASRRTARSAGASSVSRGCRCAGRTRPRARRSRRRRFACSTPSPAAARSRPAAATRIEFEAATDLDYVRGSHSYRAGLLFEAARYQSDDFSNYLGTFTFASLADFDAGRPSNFTQRTGDPNVRYSNVQFGALCAGRLPHRAEPAAQLRRPLRGADADSGPAELVAARHGDLVAVQERQDDSPRRDTDSSRTGSAPASTSRRCGSTASASARSTSSIRRIPIPVISAAPPPTNRYLLSDGLRAAGELGDQRRDRPDDHARRCGVSATYTHRRGSRRAARTQPQCAGERRAARSRRFSNVVEVVERCRVAWGTRSA